MKIELNTTMTFDRGWDGAAVRDALQGARRAVLVAHTNADGDAVGSVMGMYHLLAAACPQVAVSPMLPDGVPDDLDWLPGVNMILDGQRQTSVCRCAIAAADLIVCLDLNTLDRTGLLADSLSKAKARRLLVDHHEGADAGQWDICISEPDISSTCELVYWVMRSAFGDGVFTADAATCLYTGICTDTGTFSYSNDRQSVYLAAANLLAYGIDPMDINRRIKNVFTESRLRFFGHAMADLLTVYPRQKAALVVVKAQDMADYNVASAELTGLINEVMKLRAVDCGILVREEEGKVRLSLRSKSVYDVNRLAAEMFGGGGHKRAAGATSHLSLADTVAKVKKSLGLALVCLAVAVATAACRPVPVVDFESPKGDPLKERRIEANRLVAQSEETQIEAYVARRGWTMRRLTGGSRVMETAPGSGPLLDYEDNAIVTYSVESIGGDTIYSHLCDTVVVGRMQPTRGLDEALRSLRRGSAAVVIAPSEQGYGVVGDGDRIASRVILIYRISIK